MEQENEIDKIKKQEISEELETSYLDYAMSVIVSRALPDVRDGLKPVHRRILYAMAEGGFNHSTKFHKSANIVGRVMGSYHPHGDAAIYDSMVRMAQSFSLRYPLIDSQGNFGSMDGDSAAAMRYTEARLSLLAEDILEDLDKETVGFQPNYDGSKKEPLVLPSRIPNLLINGSSGIAVGMATNIPPHNLTEVCEAIVHLIENPDAATSDLMQFIKGPDFPTGGVIFDKKAISEAYNTGRGGIITRAQAEIVERKTGQFDIVVTEIPYQVNKSELLEKIAELVQDKKLEGIRDIRDESDKEGLRIVVVLKNDSQPQKVLNSLFKHTDLQKSFHLNVLALVDNGLQPQILSLKSILEHFIVHRQEVIRRRIEFLLKKSEARQHILEGLSLALDYIDAVIKTIKSSKSKEEAKEKLIKSFKLTAIQADAILEMRLQTLVGLEREKIEDELKEKKKEIANYKSILADAKKILKIVKEETEEVKKKFGDARRTKVVASAIGEFREEDLVAEEENIFIMSQDGFIKRIQPDVVKSQHRGGKGVLGFATKEEDKIKHILGGSTHDNLLFFTDKGRVFQSKAYEIPAASRTSRGKSIYNFLELPQGEDIASILAYNPQNGEKNAYLAMLTKKGVIKKTKLSEFASVRRSGLIALKLKPGDELFKTKFVSDKDELVIFTANGQALRFKESDLRPMGRNAAGVGGIRLKKGDEVRGFEVIKSGKQDSTHLLVMMEQGYGKRTPVDEYRLQKRAGQGVKTAKVTEKTGPVATAQAISPEAKEVLVISKNGILMKTDISTISEQSRNTQGVRVIKVGENDTVAGIVTEE